MSKTKTLLKINSMIRDFKQQIKAIKQDQTCDMWDCTDLGNW